ncbi:hypothetical protein C4K27_4796 [Pseudomonas chlororaphis subsp. chlororaphis]|nr:hypothetical protein C4K27_4796 [Pseudomonas chlororaphis subsp. chlororaphis]
MDHGDSFARGLCTGSLHCIAHRRGPVRSARAMAARFTLSMTHPALFALSLIAANVRRAPPFVASEKRPGQLR